MMRQEAKMGLKTMERMGQMGNAEEATIPDDMPFSIIDIEIAEGEDDEVEERAQGGVIEAANGFAGTTTTTNPLQTRAPSTTASPTGLKTAYTAPIVPTATTAPIGGFTYKSPIDTTKKATYKGLFGGDELTQGPDEYRTYVNDAGAEIQIPFKNGKILVGFTIPEGFKLKTDAPKDIKIQTAKTKTTRIGSDDGGIGDPASLGGARVTLGNDVEYAVQYGFDGSVSLANVGDAVATGKANFGQLTPEAADLVKQQALGQIAQLAYGFKPQVAVAQELAKKFGVSIPAFNKVQSLVDGARDATKTLQGMSLGQVFDMGRTYLDTSFKKAGVERSKVDQGNTSFSAAGVEGISEDEMRDIQAELQYGRGTESKRFDKDKTAQIARDAERARQKEVARQEAVQKAALDAAERQRVADRKAKDARFKAAQEKAEREGRVTGREAGMSMGDNDGGSGRGGVSEGPAGYEGSGFGSGFATAKGSLITRKRPKTKKMKRGGLASR